MAKKLKDGIHRCPHCGSSDVSLDAKEGKLKCAYCKTLFEAKSANEAGGVEGMYGETRGEGANDIIPGDDIVKTFKCSSCGAEVVINTDEATDAMCHWCRHIFTINETVSNGAVPDLVLPFKISKEEALEKARECIKQRTEKIDDVFVNALEERGMDGVYFPYFIVDVNARMEMKGKAEINLEPNKDHAPWSVDLYDIERDFTILVDDLTVESSSARLNQDTYVNSNNIINAILPFDTENAVAWDANYLRGFSSEKRSVNVNDLKEIVALQTGDIARRKAKETTTQYDRGVCWIKEHLGIKGTKWKAAYLPVWLFSFRRETNIDARIYYIAVNARTGETVGCLPTIIGGLPSVKSSPEIKTSEANVKRRSATPIVVFGVMMLLALILPFPIISVLFFFISLVGLPIALLNYVTGKDKPPRGTGLVTRATTHYVNTEPVSRHHHENETRAKIENEHASDIKISNTRSYSREVYGRNENRVIGSLSTGRSEMLDVERSRFQNGRSYTHAAQGRSTRSVGSSSNGSQILGFVIFIIFIFMLLSLIAGGGSGGSGGSSSSSWDYDSGSSWDSGSDWDSGSSWDSGGSDWDSGGFDYSYDY